MMETLPENFQAVYDNTFEGAVIAPNGNYRYVLWRNWGSDRFFMTFIMLNPSTADAMTDDATIRRCRRFARDHGCGGIVVVNLFAYRATDPEILTQVDDPKGPDNYEWVRKVINLSSGPVVAAWGAWWHQNQAKRWGTPVPRMAVEAMAHNANKQLWCLGYTKNRQPRHPLYVRVNQELVPFS